MAILTGNVFCLADWTEVAVADVIPVTIARLGNRVMFGEELGRFGALISRHE